MSTQLYQQACKLVSQFDPLKRRGTVRRVTGLIIEATCPPVFIGELCFLSNERLAEPLPCEVIGVRERTALLMPFDFSSDIGVGTTVHTTGRTFAIPLSAEYLGRVLD